MILLDANLVVYAWNREAPQHERSSTWLQERPNDRTGVGISWATPLSFARLVSNRRIFERAVPVAEAWRQVEEWLGLPNVWIPEPAQRHQEILRTLYSGSGQGRGRPRRPSRRPRDRIWSRSSDHGPGLRKVQWFAVGESYLGGPDRQSLVFGVTALRYE